MDIKREPVKFGDFSHFVCELVGRNLPDHAPVSPVCTNSLVALSFEVPARLGENRISSKS